LESIDDDRSLLLQEPLALFETDFLPWLRSNEMMQRDLDESKTEMELFFFSLIFVFGLFGATTSSANDEKKKPGT